MVRLVHLSSSSPNAVYANCFHKCAEIDSSYHSGSAHGPGCKFVVVVRLQEAPPPTVEKKVVPTQTIPSRLRGRRRVLIVDDDNLVRRILRRTFEGVSDDWVLEEAIDAESCLVSDWRWDGCGDDE